VPLLQDIPPIPDEHGPVRTKPQAAQADRGYGFPWIIAAVVALGIVSLLALRGAAHGSGLGKTRYVVGRTLAWFANFRRLRQCYERSWHSWQALHELAACVLCANRLHRVRHPEKYLRRKRRPRL
jgi:hypothetical protein